MPDPSYAPGNRVGRYHILAAIGEGGMGRVLRAHDAQLVRDVALKVVTWPTANARARLLREARTLARIAHPNVVPIFDVAAVGDDVIMAMELVDGADLAQWLRSPRTWREILDVFIDAGRGLRAVHAAGIVHRDFKPQNVVVGRDGRARLADFGLAVHEGRADTADPADAPLPASPRLTATGAVVGTPAYMAPEQAVSGEIDHRADQFAFCVSLFEGLFGVHPFDGTTSEQLLESIAQRRIRQVERADAPGALLPILSRGVDPDPSRRWPGMGELLSELEKCRARSQRRIALWTLAPAAVGAGALALWIAVAVTARPPRRAASPAAPTSAAATAPVITRATRLTAGPACEEYPAFSPDGQLIAFDSDRAGDWEVFTIDRKTQQLRQVTRQPGWDYMARFSPDGTRLAYLHQDERGRELRVIRLDDPELAPQSLGEVMMGAFDWRDGSTLLAASPGGALMAIGLDGSRAEHRRLPEPDYIAMVRHRRGDFGLITNPVLPPRLLLWRSGAAPRDLTPRRVMSVRGLAWSPRGDGLYFEGRSALGEPTLYWRAFDAAEEVAVESPPPGDGIDVAGDGSALAMSSCRVILRLVRLRRGHEPAELIYPGHGWDEFEPSRATSGKLLLTNTLNGVPELFLVDAASGEGRSLAQQYARQGAMSPDGRRVAYMQASPTGGDTNGLWLLELATGERRQLTRDNTDQTPVFSHDGDSIYVLRGGREEARVHRVPAAGGDAIAVTRPGVLVFAASPTADELVTIAGPPASARLYRGRAGGPFAAIESVAPARYSTVKFSPDGRKLVVSREPTDLVEITLADGKLEVVRSSPEVLQDVIYAPDGDGFFAALQVQKGNLFLLEGTLP